MSPNVPGGLTPRRRPRGRAAAALLPGVFVLLLAGVSGVAAAPRRSPSRHGEPRRSGRYRADRHRRRPSAHPTGNVSFSSTARTIRLCLTRAPALRGRRSGLSRSLTARRRCRLRATNSAAGPTNGVADYHGPPEFRRLRTAVTPTPSPARRRQRWNLGSTPTPTPKPTPKPHPSRPPSPRPSP